ncbi:MAG: hypothetical protein M1838_000280 [Thelocarpon superellum]|nr:MAG: hypothetical protein M1838_000280 [Thelocarpon superellum]
MTARKVIPIDSGWGFKQADDDNVSFLPASRFPTNVHLDLLSHGLIPDPYVSQNERHVQWVADKAWIYRTTFSAPLAGPLNSLKCALVFEGLDTYASVQLNGRKVHTSDNMFLATMVDVTGSLRKGRENELVITFESALIRGNEIREKYQGHRWACWNGEPGRLAVRKAQHHFGWDWGPKLITCGPWRPISLEVYSSRLSDLSIETQVGESLRVAEVIAKASVEGPASTVTFEILLHGKTVAAEDMILVKLAADGNQKMLRVWGGGIYEDPAFYDACDELGVLVWQDFQFACGNYPAFPAFLASVKKEAISNVRALRHHPSIVIWAGNNEDYQVREAEKLEYDEGATNPQDWLQGTFPARYIYEKILVDVMREFAPGTAYRFGSPWGGKDTRDVTAGDIHQWNVWHEKQDPYQDFERLAGRFVSEFGMQAYPDIKTIDGFLPPGGIERHAQSPTMDFHNKATGHQRRLSTYMVENIRHDFQPLEKYIYSTQLIQAECLSNAYRAFRRQWKGPGREYCAGALAWQLNDAWPGTSWSIIDYSLRPKLGYYAIKRELAPITLVLQRRSRRTRSSTDITVPKLEVWASNFTAKARTVTIRLQAWDILTGSLLLSRLIASDMAIGGNQSSGIGILDYHALIGEVHKDVDEYKIMLEATMTFSDTTTQPKSEGDKRHILA